MVLEAASENDTWREQNDDPSKNAWNSTLLSYPWMHLGYLAMTALFFLPEKLDSSLSWIFHASPAAVTQIGARTFASFNEDSRAGTWPALSKLISTDLHDPNGSKSKKRKKGNT